MLIGTLLISACSSTKPLSSVKASANNQVDGIPTEWGQPIRFSDSDSGIEYAVANNEDNLFLVFRFTNPQQQMKILASGAKLWLNTDGGNDEQNLIEFPLRREDGMPPRIEHEKNRTIMMEDLLLQKREAVFKGFVKTPQGKKTLDSIGTFQLKLLINNDESLVYEAAIPLNKLVDGGLKQSKKAMTIGLTISGLKMNERPEIGPGKGFGQGGGMRPGGHGGGMGGGMQGGRGMSGGPQGGRGGGCLPMECTRWNL